MGFFLSMHEYKKMHSPKSKYRFGFLRNELKHVELPVSPHRRIPSVRVSSPPRRLHASPPATERARNITPLTQDRDPEAKKYFINQYRRDYLRTDRDKKPSDDQVQTFIRNLDKHQLMPEGIAMERMTQFTLDMNDLQLGD
jgi:hypothetical protein